MGVHYSREVAFGALTLKFGAGTEDGKPGGPSDDGFLLLTDRGCFAGEYRVEVRGTNPDDDMVRPPVDWVKVGYVRESVLWRPVPPDGYKAFGDVDLGQPEDPWGSPTASLFGCVKETHDGFTYAHEAEFTPTGLPNVWFVTAPDYWYGTNGIRMIPASESLCYWDGSGEKPPLCVLNLPIQTVKGSQPQEPLMDSFSKPVETTDWANEREITVPFPAVLDTAKDHAWQVENSPTYTLRREARYLLEKYLDNKHGSTQQSVSYSVTKGITQTQTDTWSAKVGISVGAKAGFDIEAVKAEVSTTLSVEMGYSSAKSVSEMESRTDSGALTAPGQHAGAMYSVNHRLTAIREDGNPVGGEGSDLTFTSNQDYYYVQYPEAADDTTSVEKLSNTR